MENELIVRMLKEFVVETNQKWIHPDICEKGATAIETLMVQNKKLKSALHGTCSVCEHNRTLMVNTPCQNCLWYSDGSGLKDNWQLREELSAPNSTPDKPLSLEILRGMGGKPYWHVGLRPESEPPHWAILPDNIAKNIQDYHYGERWLAYLSETENAEHGKGDTDNENQDA